jgi:tight adherence protein C
MLDTASILIPILIFGSVGALIFLIGQHIASQLQTQRRLHTAVELRSAERLRGIRGYIAQRFDERRFRLGDERRDKLRRKLLKAGYFGADSVNYYIFLRIVAGFPVPVAIYLISQLLLTAAPPLIMALLVATSALIGIVAPDAYLARRQRILSQRYRLVFPDLLDLLLVCVDGGLGLEAAFGRIADQILLKNRELGMNLQLMGAEIRAGRSMIQALESLTDRLGLDEAASLTTMLRQSIEFGSDVSDALRVFSDEMREKRLLRAEEAANKLSVKMVLPLGICIFPVVLMVIMLPVVIKLLSVLR